MVIVRFEIEPFTDPLPPLQFGTLEGGIYTRACSKRERRLKEEASSLTDPILGTATVRAPLELSPMLPTHPFPKG